MTVTVSVVPSLASSELVCIVTITLWGASKQSLQRWQETMQDKQAVTQLWHFIAKKAILLLGLGGRPASWQMLSAICIKKAARKIPAQESLGACQVDLLSVLFRYVLK